jgi:hypothetical protein
MKDNFLDLLNNWLCLDVYHPLFLRMCGDVTSLVLKYSVSGDISKESESLINSRIVQKLSESSNRSKVSLLGLVCSEMEKQRKMVVPTLSRFPLEYYLLLRNVCSQFSDNVNFSYYPTIDSVTLRNSDMLVNVVSHLLSGLSDASRMWYNYTMAKSFVIRCCTLGLLEGEHISRFVPIFEYMENLVFKDFSSCDVYEVGSSEFSVISFEQNIFLEFLKNPANTLMKVELEFCTCTDSQQKMLLSKVKDFYYQYGVRDMWNPICSYQVYLETGIPDYLGYLRPHIVNAKDFSHFCLVTLTDEIFIVTAMSAYYIQTIDGNRVQDAELVKSITEHNLGILREYGILDETSYFKRISEVSAYYSRG